MARYAITIVYDGSEYFGFQRQPNLITVQGELEKYLSKRLSENIQVHASGRTDAGVHSIGQVAHFDTKNEIIDLDNFSYGINCLLPKSIAISSIKRVQDDFHARYSAHKKTYLYKIYLSEIQSPLRMRYYHICHYKLDVELMKKACKEFVGEHDFRSFMLCGTPKENTVRTIYDLHIEQSQDGKELNVFVCGNGFLHNMVRSIVGTLIDVGRGKNKLEDIAKIIQAKNRTQAGKTLEAKGLYLLSVEY